MTPDPDHNYRSTFIGVAEDCPVTEAEEPPSRAGRTSAARLHLQLARDEAGVHTQEQILFRTHCNAKDLDPAVHPEGGARWQELFAEGQPCLRASALAKRYGWGFHFDDEGRVTAVPVGSVEYRRHTADPDLRQLRAMRSKRA